MRRYDVDKVFSRIGDLGPEQRRCTLLLAIMHVFFPFIMLQYTFTGRDVDFQCMRNQSAVGQLNQCPETSADCTTIRFSSPTESSLTSEWQLVCSQAWKRPATMAAFMAGVLMGGHLLGALSDSRGRRTCLFVTLLAMLGANGLSGCAGGFGVYCALRWLCGLFAGGHIIALLTLNYELTSSARRGLLSAVHHVAWALGIVALSATAYVVRQWRTLAVMTTALATPLLILYWFLPESPHWLQSAGKRAEAAEVLKRIAHGNGQAWDDDQGLVEDGDKDGAVGRTNAHNASDRTVDLFTFDRSVARATLAQMYVWFAIGAAYFGLTLSAGSAASASAAPDAVYHVMAMSALVEIPGAFVVTFALGRFGRRLALIGFLLLAGATASIRATMPHSVSTPSIGALPLSLVVVSRFCVSCAGAVSFVHSAEILPTSVRSRGMGLLGAAARAGAILAPFLAQPSTLLPLLSARLPAANMGVFGALCLCGSLAAARLPETLGRPLPDTIDDLRQRIAAEQRGAGGRR